MRAVGLERDRDGFAAERTDSSMIARRARPAVTYSCLHLGESLRVGQADALLERFIVFGSSDAIRMRQEENIRSRPVALPLPTPEEPVKSRLLWSTSKSRHLSPTCPCWHSLGEHGLENPNVQAFDGGSHTEIPLMYHFSPKETRAANTNGRWQLGADGRDVVDATCSIQLRNSQNPIEARKEVVTVVLAAQLFRTVHSTVWAIMDGNPHTHPQGSPLQGLPPERRCRSKSLKLEGNEYGLISPQTLSYSQVNSI
ncbi:hypothetical protein QBC36DRAFT_353427 [Triangularia setosa]|uniref:Uncharacterized protein n=1 Tax=Triangularia setosa TaxID=2587417 RepID=A0AAN7A7B5_9PEZI|nr:hypothetical protein QBC36DRAFT_353427 [Podospora setosa]